MSDLVEPRSVDSFIAYFDVLGWKSFVSYTETENDFSVREAVDVLDMIKSELQRCREHFEADDPEMCPDARLEERDLNFQFTVFFR